MANTSNTNNTVLVPIDFSEVSVNALQHAVAVANKYGNDITLLHIEDDNSNAESEMDALVNQHGAPNHVKINTMTKSGNVSETISAVAEAGNYEMIVMGSNGPKGWKSFMGSNASKVVAEAACPVIVVKENEPFSGYKNIVMPLDLSVESKQKVNWAVHLSKKFDATIHLVYEEQTDAFSKVGIKGNIHQVTDVLNENNVKYDLHQLDDKTYPGKLYEDSLQYADATNADLVLVVSHSKDSIMDYVLKSDAENIVNKSQHATIMVVNPDLAGYTFDSTAFSFE